MTKNNYYARSIFSRLVAPTCLVVAVFIILISQQYVQNQAPSQHRRLENNSNSNSNNNRNSNNRNSNNRNNNNNRNNRNRNNNKNNNKNKNKNKKRRFPLSQFNDPKSSFPRLRLDSDVEKEDDISPPMSASAFDTLAASPFRAARNEWMDRANCLTLRGQQGAWVPSRGYKYHGEGLHIDNGSSEEEIAARTMWRWNDSAPGCPMYLISREGFCNIMERLGYRRLFFVGDSISFMMTNSFWWLMDEEGDFSSKLGYGYRKRQINCANHYTFELAMSRNDNLGDLGMDDHHDDWMEHYLENPAKTILIANTGAHTPTMVQYQNDMDRFVESVASLNRPEDMTIYRTSAPGHNNCRNQKIPLSDINEYYEAEFDQYRNYMHIKHFNQYSKDVVSNLIATTGVNWLLLDIAPMTMLRPDGHKRPNNDCLHYLYPGPQDTWNHMLYSNLLDFAIKMQLQVSDPIGRLRTPLGNVFVRNYKRMRQIST